MRTFYLTQVTQLNRELKCCLSMNKMLNPSSVCVSNVVLNVKRKRQQMGSKKRQKKKTCVLTVL